MQFMHASSTFSMTSVTAEAAASAKSGTATSSNDALTTTHAGHISEIARLS